MQDHDSPFASTENAARYLSQLSMPLTDADIMQLTALHRLGEANWSAGVIARHLGNTALQQWLGVMNAHYSSEPFTQSEIARFPQLGQQACFALAGAHVHFYHHHTDPAVVLSEDDAYCQFAQETLLAAKNHLIAIHSAQIPYAADKAFTPAEAQVISRCARVAALRYNDDTGLLLSTLLQLTSFAPGTAKTVPSQSLSIALGHAIQAYPLPETLQALAETILTIRHAGVKKKLERNLKPAQRALAERPELALKMSTQLMPGKKSTMLLANCLEAGYVLGSRFAWPVWCEQLLNSNAGSKLAQNLIWQALPPEGQPFTFMVDKKGYHDAQGQKLSEPAGCAIRLWHPLYTAAEERKCWQQRIQMQKITQPLRQAFREIGYTLNSAEFAGYWLSLSPFTALARKEGWHLDYERIVRRFGPWRVQFAVATNLYPGAIGSGLSGEITVYSEASSSVTLDSLPPVVFSEIMRAIDLLISITALSAHTTNENLFTDVSDAITSRKKSLSQHFESEIANGKLVLDTHHARAGDRAVHLVSMLETHSGQVMPLPAPRVLTKDDDFILCHLIATIEAWFKE
ncbi:DUF4132 domain-containing protein [Citrobacter youngae]|uniref:DUF4132 domain-containing protein n=1 Tax=Citrobacter youngae ATCC 29220 TaxID=500640 RepID=D4BFI0_9ENTR|nr:DUF4132 domain-containing protein [Citrobacter youngae]EFE07117.1 hypothetical protein CIT292_08997 [Citrobacter youngae ATCC 29220]